MNIYLGLAVSALLIAANAFFVAVEFALVASDRNKLEALAEGGRRPARAAVDALRKISFHLSGAQLGITISSLVLGFVTKALIEENGTIVFILAFVGATGAQMVLGELIPKNLAVSRPETAAMILSPVARIVHGVLGPLIRLFNGAANAAVRALGIEPAEEIESIASIDELDYLIRVSAEDGALAPDIQNLLSRTIRFAEKTAADALTPRGQIDALPMDATIADLVALVDSSGHSRYPVYGEGIDDIRGVVDVTAAFDLPMSARSTTYVRDVMTEPVAIPETRELLDVLADMAAAETQLLVVIDEHGGTEGILSLEDALEEIAGEIDDEYDAAEVLMVDQAEGVYLLSGTLGWSEVEEACGLELPDGDYETLAGFFLSVLGSIPAEGDAVTFADWRIEVAEMDRRRVASLVLTAPPEGSV